MKLPSCSISQILGRTPSCSITATTRWVAGLVAEGIAIRDPHDPSGSKPAHGLLVLPKTPIDAHDTPAFRHVEHGFAISSVVEAPGSYRSAATMEGAWLYSVSRTKYPPRLQDRGLRYLGCISRHLCHGKFQVTILNK